MATFQKDKYEVTTANGIATLSYTDDNAFYEDTDLSKSEIKAVFDHAHKYIEDFTKAASVEATAIMSKDKTVDKVIMAFPYGVSKRGSLDIVASRSQTFKNPQAKEGDPDIVKSTLRVAVSDPLTKVTKSVIKGLQETMTATLLS